MPVQLRQILDCALTRLSTRVLPVQVPPAQAGPWNDGVALVCKTFTAQGVNKGPFRLLSISIRGVRGVGQDTCGKPGSIQAPAVFRFFRFRWSLHQSHDPTGVIAIGNLRLSTEPQPFQAHSCVDSVEVIKTGTRNEETFRRLTNGGHIHEILVEILQNMEPRHLAEPGA